jgi:AmmeMemoRadiSam system protein B/AmmeMemoRadiSam system protein A
MFIITKLNKHLSKFFLISLLQKERLWLVVLSLFAVPVACSAETNQQIRVRAAAVAGSWYPGNAQALGKQIDKLLAEASPQLPPSEGAIRALITPHAGYRFSGAGAAAGYKLIKGQNLQRVIVLGPAHRGRFDGLSIADATHYETPLGRIPLDLEAIVQLRQNPLVVADANAHQREHSIEMQLPLLQRVLAPGWTLLPILVGQMDAKDYANAAKLLRPYADDNTLIVVSGDFTHYGPGYRYVPFPPGDTVKDRLKRLDMGAYEKIVAHDAVGFMAYREMTGITACAFGPVMVLLHLLPDSATTTLVKYYTSGDVIGDYRQAVSYLTVAITNELPFSDAPLPITNAQLPITQYSESQLAFLHQLARNTVAATVKQQHGKMEDWIALASQLSEDLQRPSGVFVTLKKQGQLRGCIGHIQPKEPLYRAIIINAIRAAHYDHRFYPVQPSELDNLELEVSVLSQPQPIASYNKFEVGKHGIILEKDGRGAVFLPEVAVEQGWNREQTLTYLAKKAGLPPDAWKTGAKFQVFTTQTYTAPQVTKP